ncbi:serine hydrolase [Pedobacter sp. WC2501]|uniref:serine hydrolase n=1 Tax=Pedobacter sp. WC2501 TaxID=3461400 RepID=UPI004046536D
MTLSAKKIFILLFLVIQGGYVFAQQDLTRKIDSVIRLANKRGVFNGNILIKKSGKILYEASMGYADASKKSTLSKNLLFDIGSVSKEFNGVSIMMLQERGLLKLEDPLSKYIPGLGKWSERVLIKHLINYTSGIPLFNLLAQEKDEVIFENLRALNDLQFEPGSAYLYNHYNVFLQMRIIEKVSGLSYADFIKENIFTPLEMNNSVVDYPTNGIRIAKAFDNEFKPTAYTQSMSGWVRLTAEDLGKWVDALDHYRLISAESYKSLSENFPGGESSLGSTSFANGQLTWHQHQGSNSNFEALLYSLPQENILIIIMTNNQQMKVHGIKSAILGILQNQHVDVPKKSVYLQVREKILANRIKGLAYYNLLRANHFDSYDFSFEIGDLLSTGKYLQRREHLDDAIYIYNLAVRLKGQPSDIAYGYELMGNCYLSKKDKPQAIKSYQKAIEVDPGNKNAKAMLSTL